MTYNLTLSDGKLHKVSDGDILVNFGVAARVMGWETRLRPQAMPVLKAADSGGTWTADPAKCRMATAEEADAYMASLPR